MVPPPGPPCTGGPFTRAIMVERSITTNEIRTALDATGGDMVKAAEMLGTTWQEVQRRSRPPQHIVPPTPRKPVERIVR